MATSRQKSRRISTQNTTNATSSSSTKKNLGYKEFRDEYKKWAKNKHDKQRNLDQFHHNDKRKKKKEAWDHKQLCMEHHFYPELIKKYFTQNELSPKLFKMCQCGTWDKKVYKKQKYEGILRIPLHVALQNADCNAKDAHFCDLKLSINEGEVTHSIQMLKVKVGAIKRYTQPATNNKVIGTATFWNNRLFFEIGQDFMLEMRLSRKAIESGKVKTVKKQCARDVAEWWYQCWGAHGIREDKKKNGEVFQFFAIHANDFVSSQSLRKNLERISIWLHKKKEIKYKVTATMNGIEMKAHKLGGSANHHQKNSFSVMKENINHGNTDNAMVVMKEEDDTHSNRTPVTIPNLSQLFNLSGCYTDFSQSQSQSSQTDRSQTPLPTPSVSPKRNRSNHNHNMDTRKRKYNRISMEEEDNVGMRDRSASAASTWSVNENEDDKENQHHKDKDEIISDLKYELKEIKKRHDKEKKQWREERKRYKKEKGEWEKERKRLMEANSKLTEQFRQSNDKNFDDNYLPQINTVNGQIVLSQENDDFLGIVEPPNKKMKLEHIHTI